MTYYPDREAYLSDVGDAIGREMQEYYKEMEKLDKEIQELMNKNKKLEIENQYLKNELKKYKEINI